MLAFKTNQNQDMGLSSQSENYHVVVLFGTAGPVFCVGNLYRALCVKVCVHVLVGVAT